MDVIDSLIVERPSCYPSTQGPWHLDYDHLLDVHPISNFHGPIPIWDRITPHTWLHFMSRVKPNPKLHKDLVGDCFIPFACLGVYIRQL